MLVEFFGLPGSGKSSISRDVAKLLQAKGLPIDEVTYDIDHRHRRPVRALFKFARLARYAALKPRLAISLGAKLKATQQETLSDLVKETLNCMFIASLAARTGPHGSIVLLDQGIGQALWSVGFSARNRSWLDLLLDSEDLAAGPDIVIHVRAGFETIRERLSGRKPHVSRLESALGNDDQPLLRAEALSEAVLARLKRRGIPIIEVVNDCPEQLDLNARLASAAILSMLRNGREMSAKGEWNEVELPSGDDASRAKILP